MLHPHTELRIVNATIGYGVFATEAIPMGTITWALDPLDQILDLKKTRKIESKFDGSVEHFSWTNGLGKRILCWDFGRYMNHNCDANSIGPGGAEYELAVRDIAKGEEITSDYRTLNLEEPMDCCCGAAQCKGVVSAADLEEIADDCDQVIQNAVSQIHHVDQPLWRWIHNKSSLHMMANVPTNVPSVLRHRWPPALHSSQIPDSIT